MARVLYGTAALLSVTVGGLSFAASCSISSLGAGPPADAAADDATDGSGDDAQDAGVESARPSACNASNCGGACCGDKCIARSCAGCNTGTTFCPFSFGPQQSNGRCVASCSDCQQPGLNAPTTCYACAPVVPPVMCAPSPDHCPASLDAGACSCASGDAGECPGSMQVCMLVGGQYVCLSR
jgi:hypothetical protein